MGAACPSKPPDPLRPKTLPLRDPSERANVKDCPRVRKGDERAVEALNRVLLRRGTSNVELGEVVGCGESVIRAIRSRDRRRPFKAGLFYAVDLRTALALLDETRVDLLTQNPAHREV